jgi:DNA-binding phage protein
MKPNDTKELLSILKANTNQLQVSKDTGLPQGNISRALNNSSSLSTFVTICNASNIKIKLKNIDDDRVLI